MKVINNVSISLLRRAPLPTPRLVKYREYIRATQLSRYLLAVSISDIGMTREKEDESGKGLIIRFAEVATVDYLPFLSAFSPTSSFTPHSKYTRNYKLINLDISMLRTTHRH